MLSLELFKILFNKQIVYALLFLNSIFKLKINKLNNLIYYDNYIIINSL